MKESAIIGQPCWTKHDGHAAGEIIDHGYGVHGFRVLVVNQDGDLIDCDVANVSLRELTRGVQPFRPAPARPDQPLGTGTGGGPLSKPPTLG